MAMIGIFVKIMYLVYYWLVQKYTESILLNAYFKHIQIALSSNISLCQLFMSVLYVIASSELSEHSLNDSENVSVNISDLHWIWAKYMSVGRDSKFHNR